jgi:hypothetical protein
MTDTQLSQLKNNLMAQFQQMMSEEIAPDPEDNLGAALAWASRF